ncbi:MAG: hypothetical protein HC904_16765 [Blastochloris sp.]|nr:hypothetical protein [Blastochloris sp.]
MKTPWFVPSPQFGYTLTRIDEHPWNTLLTMKEVLRLEPGSIEFTGPHATGHDTYWREHLPHLFTKDLKPVMVLDTSPIHPHAVETEPRRPFRHWKG